jgi:hypothetical protein
LRRGYLEEIQLGIMTIGTELCVLEPRSRKFLSAISHVFATEHTQLEQFFGCQFRFEIGMKVPADWLGAEVDVTRLHQVVDRNSPLSHANGCVAVSGAPAEEAVASVVMVEVDETDVSVETPTDVVAATSPEQAVNITASTQRRILPP